MPSPSPHRPSNPTRRRTYTGSQPSIPGLLDSSPAHLAQQREQARADLERAAATPKQRSQSSGSKRRSHLLPKGERVASLVPTPWPDSPCLAVARCEGEVAWVAPEGTDVRAAYPLFPGEYRRSPLAPQLYRYGLPHDLRRDLQGHLRAIASRWGDVPPEILREGDRLSRLLDAVLCYDESEENE